MVYKVQKKNGKERYPYHVCQKQEHHVRLGGRSPIARRKPLPVPVENAMERQTGKEQQRTTLRVVPKCVFVSKHGEKSGEGVQQPLP